jgi:hypothetical protein
MIEGLKVTVSGKELKTLCLARAAYHKGRVRFYEDKATSLKGIDSDNSVGFSNSSSGDPIKQMEASALKHKQQAEELAFTAEHLVAKENYLLARADLNIIGVVAQAW